MKNIDFETFKKQVSQLPREIVSIEGQRYQIKPDAIEDDKLPFIRKDRKKKQNPEKVEKLDLKKLHKFYTEADDYKTTTATEYGLGGKQSPAVAVILALLQKEIKK